MHEIGYKAETVGERTTGAHDETKWALLTTEFCSMVALISVILIAAAISDSLDDVRAWTLVAIVGTGYIVRRGIAKAGTGAGEERQAHGSHPGRSSPSPDMGTYVLMTSQGTAHGRFRRAIEKNNLFLAELAARERRAPLPLDDALELVYLIAGERPERLPAAVLRWHGRLELEAATLTVEESQLALAVLAHLPSGGEEERALLRRLLRTAKPTLLPRMS